MKFVVFYLQFINSLESVGMFFSSAALIRRFHRYAATVRLSITCKINQAASKNMQNFIYFSSAKF